MHVDFLKNLSKSEPSKNLEEKRILEKVWIIFYLFVLVALFFVFVLDRL